MRQTRWILIAGVFVLTLLVIEQTTIGSYIDLASKTRSAFRNPLPIFSSLENVAEEDTKEMLLQRIREEAAKRKIEPVDARIDPVWKAIPGYNGLEADIEASYRLSQGLPPGEPPRLVMKEVSPRIHLDDLGPYPVYKGNPLKPMVSLMINVAWGEEYIPAMLEILEKEHVHATFFFDGSWLQKHLPLANEIKQKGHELSNHAYSHRNMSQLSRREAMEEITKTQRLLEQSLQVRNTLFAPPSGDFDRETVEIAYTLKLRTVLWSLDTVDWQHPGPESILRKISARVEPGSMILMHPTASASQALEGMIKEIKRKGLALGTVSDLLSPYRVSVESPFLF